MRLRTRIGLWQRATVLVSIGALGVVGSAAASPAAAAAGCTHGCLTIATSPDPSTAGQRVTISGRLGGRHHGRAVVLLWRRLPGSQQFQVTEATRTDPSGRYSMTARIDANRWWYVSAPGSRSSDVHQRVAELAALGASETRAAPGDLVTLTAGIDPAQLGQRVILEQLGRGGWHQIAQAAFGRRPTFSLVHSFDSDGTYHLRAYMPWGPNNINSYSAPVSIDMNGIFKIKHVVIIMQENRSFDQYFGTFPGADGIPGLAGNPGTVPCVPDPMNGGCVQPFRDTSRPELRRSARTASDRDMARRHRRAGCRWTGSSARRRRARTAPPMTPTAAPAPDAEASAST